MSECLFLFGFHWMLPRKSIKQHNKIIIDALIDGKTDFKMEITIAIEVEIDIEMFNNLRIAPKIL